MIRQFFKEYSVWYLTYILLSILFIVIFALYRLPLAYFKVSILINFTILIFISIWQYLKFKQKLSILHHFIYVKELDELELPSELAYKDIIIKLKETSANELLAEKTQTENLQNLVKMWSHQMKVPISALSLMAQTDQLDSNEV